MGWFSDGTPTFTAVTAEVEEKRKAAAEHQREALARGAVDDERQEANRRAAAADAGYTGTWTDPETGFAGSREDRANYFTPAPEPAPPPKKKKEKAHVVKSATIWDQQCFLVENMKRLTKIGGLQEYDNFGTLEGAPGSIVSTLHRGSLNDTSVNTMLNLSPSQYAFLVPHMKLYRVLYEKDNPLVVIGEQEIPIESFTSRENIENILTDQEARQAGAGLKSFTWKLDGVQPEEVDNNITATLEMHFQSIHELFRHGFDPTSETAQAGRINHPSFLDLIIAPESSFKTGQGGNQRPSAIDSDKKCSLDNTQALTYEGALYRIKIDVGWAVPAGMENHPGIGDHVAFEEALQAQRKTLFLQLARHNISFQQDGVVKLTVEYQAALNGILRSQWSNIFAGPEQLRDVFEEDQTARMLREDHRDQSIDLSDAEKDELEEYLDRQIALEQEDRLIKYRRVLKHIYDTDKISSIRIPMIELLQPGWRELTPEQRARRAKRRQGSSSTRGYTINASGVSAGSEPHELLENMENGAVLDKEEIERMGKGLNSIVEATPSDKVDIHYFYLGDLINSVLELPQIKKQIDKDNYQIVLGSVEYIDPLMAYQIKNLDAIVNCGGLRKAQEAIVLDTLNPLARSGGSQIIEHISMAAIPISVDAFNQWFFDRVIKKNRTKYYLDQFIRDLLGSLVGRAMSSRCFSGIPQVPLRFATNDFFIAGAPVKGERLQINSLRDRVRKRMKEFPKRWGEISDEDRAAMNDTQKQAPTPTLFIYSTDSLPAGTTRHKWYEDHDIGIYHFYLGAAGGLVKKIEFQREDMPYFREAKIHKEGALGATQLRELYKVKMTMIGNTLLKNGQYIYINPTAIGAGSQGSSGDKQNIARMLGLGGYFLVTSVSHRVSLTGFEVTVEALHQAVPDSVEKTVPAIAYDVDPERSPRIPRRRKKKKERLPGHGREPEYVGVQLQTQDVTLGGAGGGGTGRIEIRRGAPGQTFPSEISQAAIDAADTPEKIRKLIDKVTEASTGGLADMPVEAATSVSSLGIRRRE
jgi:hypothetical protein|tara:strand:+ start:2655 stop:5762 length:3108 start_codon:yes stop_codon:yes gene_type:complete